MQTQDGRLECHAEVFGVGRATVDKPSLKAFEVSPSWLGDNDPPHGSALLSEVPQSHLDLFPRDAACSVGLIANRLKLPPIGGVAFIENTIIRRKRRRVPRCIPLTEALRRRCVVRSETVKRVFLHALANRLGTSAEAIGKDLIDLQCQLAIRHVPTMFHPQFVVNAVRRYDPPHDHAQPLRHPAL